MKREERNEFNHIKKLLKKLLKEFPIDSSTTLTIRTDGSPEFKQALHEHYTSLGFHPANVKVDSRMYDEKERIIYIPGLTFDMGGEEHPWTELYSADEKARFAAALQS